MTGFRDGWSANWKLSTGLRSKIVRQGRPVFFLRAIRVNACLSLIEDNVTGIPQARWLRSGVAAVI